MKLRKQFQLTVILLLAITAPATAQFTQNAQFAPFNILTRTSIPVVIQCPGCNAANRNNRTKTTKTTVTKTEIGKFSYNPSVTVRQRIVTRLAEDVRAKYPDAAEKIEQNFISNDIIGQMNKIMVTSGLNPNNLADAYAFYLANAWQAFSGRNENLSKTEIVAIRSQTTRILLATPKLLSATDAQKQEIAELMLIQAVFVSASIEGAKSDPTQLANAKASIAKSAKSFGLDFDRMKLTAQGFEFTK